MSISETGFHYLCDYLKRRSAIVLSDNKTYLVESRLTPLVRKGGFADIDALLSELRRDESHELARNVIEAMTTNETSFFRDLHPWDALKTVLLPTLIKARADSKKITIWCAAASTGQEPYTIAMVVRELFPLLRDWQVQVVATDINSSVLERAKEGVYSQAEINRGLPAPMLVKHFERKGTEWQVKKELRDLISFQPLNLVEFWTLPRPLDIVFMRNVLIYFDTETKRSILSRARTILSPDGYLILGGAETTANLDDSYETVRAGNSYVYQPQTTGDRRVTHVTG